MLIGNLVAILFSALVTTTISLIWPDNYDYKSMREIPMVDDSETGAPALPFRLIGSLAPAMCLGTPQLHLPACSGEPDMGLHVPRVTV